MRCVSGISRLALALSAVLQSFRPRQSLLCSQAFTESRRSVGKLTTHRRRCGHFSSSSSTSQPIAQASAGQSSYAIIRQVSNSAKNTATSWVMVRTLSQNPPICKNEPVGFGSIASVGHRAATLSSNIAQRSTYAPVRRLLQPPKRRALV
jgi:hypothetical protein